MAQEFQNFTKTPFEDLEIGGPKCMEGLLRTNATTYLEAEVRYVEFSLNYTQIIKYADTIIRVCQEFEQKSAKDRVVFRFLAAFNRSVHLKSTQLEEIYKLPLGELDKFLINTDSTSRTMKPNTLQLE